LFGEAFFRLKKELHFGDKNFFSRKTLHISEKTTEWGWFFFKEKLGLLDVFSFCEAVNRQEEEADRKNQEENRQHI
jgi:hypothetical protein